VYRVAQSTIADAARTRARSVLQLVDETPEIATQEVDGSDDIESELGARVARFVARLPGALPRGGHLRGPHSEGRGRNAA
jgi:DNA-directed RNA polymerase specialized sigma24 family protein